LAASHYRKFTRAFAKVLDVDTTSQMMKLVESGLADVALTNTIDGLMVLKAKGINTVEPIEKALARLDLFHYIHIDKTTKINYLLPVQK
jgi:polar amino acid transport system substrate-binding protein